MPISQRQTLPQQSLHPAGKQRRKGAAVGNHLLTAPDQVPLAALVQRLVEAVVGSPPIM